MSINPRWLTSTVVDLAQAILAEQAAANGWSGTVSARCSILADALMDAGCDSGSIIQLLRAPDRSNVIPLVTELAKSPDQRAAEAEAARLAAFRASPLGRCGVVGKQNTLQTLQRSIKRARGRSGPGSAKYAKIYAERLQQLADRRWARVTKGQRAPTPAQAFDLVSTISRELAGAEGRCTQRTLSVGNIIRVAQAAARDGLAHADGGRPANSYGYSYTMTTASARRVADGTVEVDIRRTGSAGSVAAHARHWQDVTVDYAVLKGGGRFAIRRKHGWDCYSDARTLVGVAVAMPADLKDKFGPWEHAASLDLIPAELDRKRTIIQAEREAAAKTKLDRQAAAKAEARAARAAQLLTKIGARQMVSYEDVRALGACDAGIRAFAQRLNLPLDAKIPLTKVAEVEPAWAVKLARRLLAAHASA